jgi:hypothetical protein
MRAGLISRGAVLVGALSVMSLSAAAQNPAGTPSEQAAPSASNVRTVEISPADAEVEAGQELKFTAVGKDATGQPLDEKPATWFARPGDVAAADDGGPNSWPTPSWRNSKAGSRPTVTDTCS